MKIRKKDISGFNKPCKGKKYSSHEVHLETKITDNHNVTRLIVCKKNNSKIPGKTK